MCLTLKNFSTDIAKRNIVCWKVVDPIKDSVPPQWLPKRIEDTGAYEFNKVCKARKIEWSEGMAPVRGLVKKSKGVGKRVLREIDHLEIKRVGQEGLLTIEEGFHAFQTYKDAKSSYFKFYPFYPCIIPKGSEYGLGIFNDIVSTRIIVFSSFMKFLKYLLLPWTR